MLPYKYSGLALNEKMRQEMILPHRIYLQSVSAPVSSRGQDMAGNIFDDFTGFIAGLGEALTQALGQIVQVISTVIQTILDIIAKIAEVLANILGKIFETLGAIFRGVANFMVVIMESTYKFIKEAPIFKDVFRELDNFTGGMLSGVMNVSTLPFRAMRGDPISKQELAQAALLGLQIASLWFGGPVPVGMFIGGRVGQDFCSKQSMNKEAKQACVAAFVIAGGAGAAAIDEGMLDSQWATFAQEQREIVSGFFRPDTTQSDAITQSARESAAAGQSVTQTFTSAASVATQQVISNQVIGQLCKEADDPLACQIFAQAGLNYLGSDRSLYDVVTDGAKTYLIKRLSNEIVALIVPPRPITGASPGIKYTPTPLPAAPNNIRTVYVEQPNPGLYLIAGLAAAYAIFAFGG